MMVTTLRPSPGEARAARVVAAGGAVLWGVLFFGVVALAVAVEATPGRFDYYVVEAGWGLLFTALVALPLAVLAARPRSPVLLLQLLAAGLAISIAAVVCLSIEQALAATILLVNVAFVVDLTYGRLKPPPDWSWPRLDPLLAVLALVALPGSVVHAAAMVRAHYEQRPLAEGAWGLDQWPVQAALPLAVLLGAAVVAAGVGERWGGTRTAAVSVAGTAVWFGTVSMLYPGHAGSLDTLGGIAAVVWGTVFVAAAFSGWRQGRPSPRWRGTGAHA